jgi:hypothetical protein
LKAAAVNEDGGNKKPCSAATGTLQIEYSGYG